MRTWTETSPCLLEAGLRLGVEVLWEPNGMGFMGGPPHPRYRLLDLRTGSPWPDPDLVRIFGNLDEAKHAAEEESARLERA